MLWPLALALGWDPSPEPARSSSPWCSARSPAPASASAWPARCKALVTLAAANGLYLVLLLLSGMVIPLDELPGPAAGRRAGPARAAPSPRRSAAASPRGVDVPGRAWAVLAAWAVAGPARWPPASSAGSEVVSNTIAIYRDGHERTTSDHNHTTEAAGAADPSRATANDLAEAACAAATCARPS